MNKAIFLDRDGVIITERGDYNYLPADISLVHGISEALQELQKKGYIFIVITNQGGIARELYGHDRVHEIHDELKAHFESENVDITEFYYCPHHPNSSACICRKPDSLMLEKALARFDIDASASWFIGDNDRDIEAGKKAGIRTLLIPSNADLREYLSEIF